MDAVDTLGCSFSLLLTPLPGPNVPGYYFTFRVVGHLLAVRGARQGLRVVVVGHAAERAACRTGGLELLPPQTRAPRIRAIAAELGLPRLTRFYERTAVEIA